jgi:DNA polymerase-4
VSTRKIIHIDMDAFFASVEQRDDPRLRGLAVAVGHAGQRGVVAAASYEARAFGVRSATPSVTAKRNCPNLVFVAPRFEIYRAVSQQIRVLFSEYTALVEPLSLDEAYLDVTENRRGLPSASATASEIRARILGETGLTASAGISYNKFLAKLASDHKKPNGQFVITPQMGAAFIAALPIAKFHGVGPVTTERMNRLGIFTGADLKRQTLPFLKRHFGKSGEWYYAIARGIDDRAVVADRPRKSAGSETTLAEDLTDTVAIESRVLAMADDVWTWCEKAHRFGRTVTVKIKYADFRQSTRSRTLPRPVATRETLCETSVGLIRTVFPPALGIRLVGVSVSGFEQLAEPKFSQLGLDL